MDKQKALEIGDRIELFGGYYYDPLFLKNPRADKRMGTVINFIPGKNQSKAAVVRLHDKIKGNNISGDLAVLELRYVDQTWSESSPVHIELCDFMPEDNPWKDRRQGEWIEAAATFRIIE
jgi:hypothetical protein